MNTDSMPLGIGLATIRLARRHPILMAAITLYWLCKGIIFMGKKIIWFWYAGLGLCLLLFIHSLEALTSVSISLTEMVSRNWVLNYYAAVGLVVMGFLGSCAIYRIRTLHPVRRGLLSYILGAVGMAGIYYMISVSHSGCYSFASEVRPATSVIDFVYFSFVTVTTLGYGDIVPNHPFIRLLVIVQLLYGAYLVSSMTTARCIPCESEENA